MSRSVFAVAAAFLATAAFAQLTLEKRDGTVDVIPLVTGESGDVIVEFRDPPLAVVGSQAGKTAMADHRATVARFRGDLARIVAAHAAGKSAIEPEIRWEYSNALNGVSARVPRSAVAEVAALPYVKQVHADREVHAMASDNITQIGADRVWATLGSRGKGVVVAVIDTGIDYHHPALGAGIGPGFKIIGGYDFANRDSDPLDDHGHGTHVAGIIAGDSDRITGVAPDASLIAYKVLKASGSGSESDVIAAIDRALDPNGDGVLNDHVDVANLSLGGDGNPDDAASHAIDNATQGGIVFCVAAGNSGRYHRISSPGTSRSAITVAAVDAADSIATFSSRGPNPKDMAIKPDVAAPGVSILSSLPNNTYGSASGTSMATPHVAGVCALLKALHPDWSPDQIKAAVMGSAALATETMAAGAGRVDAYAAATSGLRVDPPSVSFALQPLFVSEWAPSRTLRLTNTGRDAVAAKITTTAPSGMTAVVSPETVNLPPGQSDEVTLTLSVPNDASVKVDSRSFSAGGMITVASSVKNLARVPWSFVKAVRATITWDKDLATAVLLDAAHTTFYETVPLTGNAMEALLASTGRYDIVIYGSTFDEQSNRLTRASFVYRENQALDGDSTIAATEAEARRTLRGAGVDESGLPFAEGSDRVYIYSGRLIWPSGAFKSITIPPLTLHEIHFNDIADHNTVLMNESFFDMTTNSFYAVQHPGRLGIDSDVTLTNTAAALRSAAVRLLIPPVSHGDARVSAQIAPFSRLAGDSSNTVSVQHLAPQNVWNARVFLTPDVSPSYSDGIAFSVIADGLNHFNTPLLRLQDDSITTGTPPAGPYFGEAFVFGGGPRRATNSFTVLVPLRPSLSIEFFGPLGESRAADRGDTSTSVFLTNDRLVTTSTGLPILLDLTAKRGYTIVSTNDAFLFPNVASRTTLTMKLDSSRADYLPPALTSLVLLDGAGRSVQNLAPHGGGALIFGATDTSPSAFVSPQAVRADAISLAYRYAGSENWIPLSAVGQANSLLRADLGDVANIDRALVDLKIDLSDDAGNTTTVVMSPAFSVGTEHPPRHRAAAR